MNPSLMHLTDAAAYQADGTSRRRFREPCS
jgi:hypothetical protein